jgi:hypothetical protein
LIGAATATAVGPKPAKTSWTPPILANARIGRVRIRTEGRFRLKPQARFESLDIVGEWGGRESGDRHGGSWRAEIGYEGPNKRLRGAIGYVRQFKKVAVTASLGAGSDGALSAGLNLAFSLGADPARPGHIRMTSERLATQGQVLATIYRDVNGDGIRQSDEPAEPDVQLTAGRVPVERLSDAKGQVIVDGIQPYQALLIGVAWCGREDSNFHGLSPTTTSTLRVYQFRHDRAAMVGVPNTCTATIPPTRPNPASAAANVQRRAGFLRGRNGGSGA